ncbi:restriction endonuclease subunit S [Anaerosporobacter faecicola]|uniref:restriction endonuclease subunit S n=1 Tax=Anaerosporobacter faecicola TaxID=2718714 RepID=UPI00143C54B6|nr:restriction endonuclease subunit S [Anaerosporobacter faecicola]
MQKIELKSIGKFQSGGTPSKKESSYFGGDIPWITTVALNGEKINQNNATDWLTDSGVTNSATKIVPPYSLMVGTRVGVGKVAVNTVEMCTNQDIISIVDIDRDNWNLDYLRYFIKSVAPVLNAKARGATIQGIKLEVLQATKIPLIDIADQKRIANILQKTQKIIDDRKKQLLDLDELVKSRFIELFGAYPQNEKGWDEGTIRDIVNEVRYGSSRPAVEGGKYPYLRMNNITYSGELDLSDVKQIDVPENELPKCTVARGDVLFNRTNSKELVGKTCVYNRDEMMVLAGFVVRVRVNTELAIPEFLSTFMNMDFTKKKLFSMAKAASGQANINAQELQSMGIYIPPVTLQKEFLLFKEQVDKQKIKIEKSLDELQELFNSLMQKYFK